MGIIKLQRIIKAPLEKIWAVAGDFTKCPVPAWPIEIINQGDANNHKIGCERLVKDGKSTYRERLEAVDPLHSITYVMLSGAPLKHYTGKVELFPAGEGTLVIWSIELAPKIPGTGWIVNKVSRKNTGRFLDELEKAVK